MRAWLVSPQITRNIIMAWVIGTVLAGSTARFARADTSTVPFRAYVPAVHFDASIATYMNRASWLSAIAGGTLTEDFESDPLHYDAVSYPYQTGAGFTITGDYYSSASIVDFELLHTGKYLHTRAWYTGLTFEFPQAVAVRAFGFDYRPSEQWHLRVNSQSMALPTGSQTLFFGVVMSGAAANSFNLVSALHAQGGISLDNISYAP